MTISLVSWSMGGRNSSLRAFSCFSLHSIPPTLPSLQDISRTSHFTRARLFLTPSPRHFLPFTSVPSSSSSSSSSSSAFSSSSFFEGFSEQRNEIEPASPPILKGSPAANRMFPLLSPKEKKELRAYAHSLGKKIVSQQIGKAGVTESLAKAISDALEAKEILKLKVLDNCPDELDEVIVKIEEATQGQVVGKIGSVLTLYRPSLRKLTEAKKPQSKFPDGRTKKIVGSAPFGRRR